MTKCELDPSIPELYQISSNYLRAILYAYLCGVFNLFIIAKSVVQKRNVTKLSRDAKTIATLKNHRESDKLGKVGEIDRF